MNPMFWVAMGPWIVLLILYCGTTEYYSWKRSQRRKMERALALQPKECKYRAESGECLKDGADYCDHDGVECCLVNGFRP